ncbi:hypothetical protein [Vannielia litorea]|uniref:Uncharacterized protein n=1 Tax=Vannielia litorea TaxID=1217970 RepID=A0A1N6E4F0_9RHOB|nr:hypothetical protein [Vannielia litorea]SIN77886.1 hypothetical protein SAMN05444002_0320 [Vannielia litorea]
MINRAPKTITNPLAELAQNALFILGAIIALAAFGAFSNGEYLGMLICGGLSLGAFQWGASIKTRWNAKSQITTYE